MLGDYRTTDVLIEHNEVEDTNNPARIYPWDVEPLTNKGGNECITVGGGVDGIAVRRNLIHDSLQYGIDFKLQVRNFAANENEIHDVRAHGIYLDAACRPLEHGVIARNLIYGCKGNAITLAREAARGPREGYEQSIDDIAIVANVGVRCNRGLLIYKHPKDNLTKTINNVRIVNNTFHDSKLENVRLVDLAPVVANFVFANNLHGTSGRSNIVNQFTGTPGYTEIGSVTRDPGWADSKASRPNMRIRVGSVADGVGSATYAPEVDLGGDAYASPPAAGAFEAIP